MNEENKIDAVEIDTPATPVDAVEEKGNFASDLLNKFNAMSIKQKALIGGGAVFAVLLIVGVVGSIVNRQEGVDEVTAPATAPVVSLAAPGVSGGTSGGDMAQVNTGGVDRSTVRLPGRPVAASASLVNGYTASYSIADAADYDAENRKWAALFAEKKTGPVAGSIMPSQSPILIGDAFLKEEIEGYYLAKTSGQYTFAIDVNSNGEVSIFVDGTEIISERKLGSDAPSALGSINLEPGLHAVKIKVARANIYQDLPKFNTFIREAGSAGLTPLMLVQEVIPAAVVSAPATVAAPATDKAVK